jgi:hypothetical protein
MTDRTPATPADSFIANPRAISAAFPWISQAVEDIIAALPTDDPKCKPAEMLAWQLLDRLKGKRP